MTANDARRWIPYLGPAGVLVFALTIATVQYRDFLADPRPLWSVLQHDRSAHYLSGLGLAQGLARGNVAEIWHLIDSMRVWGPFHALLLVPIEMIGGPDYRLAVLPSLAGWVLTMVSGYLLARRIAPWGGDLAGIVAVLFIAASPAHRAFAVDIMLESLGAGLSLMCLYLYVALVQEQKPRLGWALGVGLALLFLEKYNYFILVSAGLVGAELLRQPALWLNLARTTAPTVPAWLLGQLRRPSTYLLVGLVAAAIGARVLQGQTIRLLGHEIPVGSPHNIWHAAWFVLTVRLVVWLRMPATQTLLRDLGPWRGAVLPPGWTIVVWFLMPKRLGYFFWYLAASDQHREKVPFLHGAPFYWEVIGSSYHVALWALIAVLAMGIVGILAFRVWRPGGIAALTFLSVGMLLTFQHPMLKDRFVHSWLAIGWVVAGVGFATVAMAPWWRSRIANGMLAIVGLGILTPLIAPYVILPGSATEGGPNGERPCVLALTDDFLPGLADVREPTLLSNSHAMFFLSWVYQERYPHRPFVTEIRGYGLDPAENREAVRRWLVKTRSEAIVLIDIAPESPYFNVSPENRDYAVLRSCLAETPTFAVSEEWTMPEGVTITIWRRVSS